jgi:hypothetical protein
MKSSTTAILVLLSAFAVAQTTIGDNQTIDLSQSTSINDETPTATASDGAANTKNAAVGLKKSTMEDVVKVVVVGVAAAGLAAAGV